MFMWSRLTPSEDSVEGRRVQCIHVHSHTCTRMQTNSPKQRFRGLLGAPGKLQLTEPQTDSLGVRGMPGNLWSQSFFSNEKLLLTLKLQATFLPELALFLSTSQMQ